MDVLSRKLIMREQMKGGLLGVGCIVVSNVVWWGLWAQHLR